MTAKAAAKIFASKEVTITRVFNASRETVFRAWTDPKQVAQWWGPKGFTNPVCEVDPKPGGALRIVMRAPDGNEYPMKGTFREVIAPSSIVFTSIAVDKNGRHLLEGNTTVTFAEEDGKTRLALHSRAVGLVEEAVGMLEGMQAGWTQSIDRLEALIRAGS